MRSEWLHSLALAMAIGAINGLIHPTAVHADNDKAAAEALFDEARRLMADKHFAEACPKLEASQRLDPGVGTMLNLADCYEKSGKTASAWAQFRDTISAARKAGSLDREEIARTRARELEPKLSYLTIVTWQGQEVLVLRDGNTVDSAMLGTPIPVDPGTHEITASAEGKRRWTTTVDVPASPGTTKVAVPILPDESGGDGAAAQPALGGEGSTTAASDGANDGSTQRILAGVVGGVGVVGVVVGSVFGLKASSDWDDAKSDCNPYPKCGPEGAQLGEDASDAATISTVAFVVGGAAIAGGVILWLTAPDGDSSETAVGIGPGRVLVHGRF
jgi:hypothetical protein